MKDMRTATMLLALVFVWGIGRAISATPGTDQKKGYAALPSETPAIFKQQYKFTGTSSSKKCFFSYFELYILIKKYDQCRNKIMKAIRQGGDRVLFPNQSEKAMAEDASGYLSPLIFLTSKYCNPQFSQKYSPNL